MLAGFEQPTAGRILLDGKDIATVPPHQRPINMMFQNYALFPHLTVRGNVAFGLRQEGMRRKEIRDRVDEMLALVKLDGLGPRRIHQLSGGQRQRVALARALAKRPRLFLLDEPLAALDRKLREETRFELAALQHRLGLTFIIVTHDQQEAMVMADRIGVMNAGRLVQVGRPREVYEQPLSLWLAGFVGDVNVLTGRVVSSGLGHTVIDDRAGGKLLIAQSTDAKPGDEIRIALRPEKLQIGTEAGKVGGENIYPGVVIEAAYLGDKSLYKVRLDNGIELRIAAANRARMLERPIGSDDRVWVSWPAEAAMVLQP
jgi:putrescine transport system ATP-binding protein